MGHSYLVFCCCRKQGAPPLQLLLLNLQDFRYLACMVSCRSRLRNLKDFWGRCFEGQRRFDRPVKEEFRVTCPGVEVYSECSGNSGCTQPSRVWGWLAGCWNGPCIQDLASGPQLQTAARKQILMRRVGPSTVAFSLSSATWKALRKPRHQPFGGSCDLVLILIEAPRALLILPPSRRWLVI